MSADDLVDAWVERFLDWIDVNSDYLTDLDRKAGDGDFGHNMSLAASRARTFISDADQSAAARFDALSRGFRSIGGSSGPLLGSWFRDFSRAFRDHDGVDALCAAAANGLASVQRLGNAQVGDRTMVDAMAPAAAAISASSGLGFGPALNAAAFEGARGAEATSEMVGRRGRSSYMGDTVLKVPDPGAILVAAFFEAGRVTLDDGVAGSSGS